MPDQPRPAPSSPAGSWVLGAICALTVGLYALVACTRDSELGNRTAAGAYYNLLVSGFGSGQLSLKQEAPAGLAQLADPYDPDASSAFRGAMFTEPGRVHDLSYFHGRLYLYFGVTPALLLFWPFALTGHFISHQQAVALFAAAGFLLSVWLLRAAWRRYFPEVSPWLVAAGALALGLANGFPIVLNRPDVWEVPIFCGYALVMLTLVALWRSVHVPESRVRALALASLAYGLAVGARPSLLFGSVVLLVPVFLDWPTTGSRGCAQHITYYVICWAQPGRRRLLLAAFGPITAVGLGLMAYNQARFGSPFEFGQTYQLAGERQDRAHFGLAHLWFNLRAYFLAPAGWGGGFPFVQDAALPPPPAGHGGVEMPFGAVVMLPFTWLALALALVRRDFGDAARRGLAVFLAAPAVLFFTSALVLGCFYGTCLRYEVEFVPMLVLLAAIGALALDRGLAGRVGWRRAARLATGGLLLYSLAFNLLAGMRWRAELVAFEGVELAYAGRMDEAAALLEEATWFKPSHGPAQMSLALVYARTGRADAASARIAEALRLNPTAAAGYYENFGQSLVNVGRPEDLLTLLQAARRQEPGAARWPNEIGAILAQTARTKEALPYFEEAVRLEPGNAGNLANLGLALAQEGHAAEAVAALQKALQLDPSLDAVRAFLARLQPAAGSPPPFLRKQ